MEDHAYQDRFLSKGTGVRLRSRELFRRHDNGRPVINGFVTYVSNNEPIIMLRTGYEDYSDAYDDFSDCVSFDNGRTWTDPELRLKSCDIEGSRVRYAEPAALFDPATEKLIAITDRILHPRDELDVDARYALVLDTYDPALNKWSGLTPLEFDHPYGVALSFCSPIKTSTGRLVFPAQTHLTGDDGKPLHYKGCWSPAGVIMHVLGDYRSDGSIEWKLSSPVVPNLENTSRGFYEPAVAEIRDGRLAMILRGDNSMFPERPGYKWLSLSEDNGETWSEPVPLPCDEGDPIESSSTGSALFRSIKTGKLYWMGNLCIHGRRPNGNYPRTPLVVAEVREVPFALKRGTITVIDQRAAHEPEEVQMSNFRFYQDRENGDLVVFLTRYAEVSAKDWKRADYYRYRVEMS